MAPGSESGCDLELVRRRDLEWEESLTSFGFGGFAHGFDVLGTGGLEMLLVDDAVEFQFRAQFVEGCGFSGEMIIGVVAIGQSLAAIWELAFADAVNLQEFGTFGFDFASEVGDECIDGFFDASGVEDDESFVVTFHEVVMGLVCCLEIVGWDCRGAGWSWWGTWFPLQVWGWFQY